MAQNWYVRTANGEEGPISSRELGRRAAALELKAEDLVSLDRVKWVPAAKVKGLKFGSERPSPMQPNAPQKTGGRKQNTAPVRNQTIAHQPGDTLPEFLVSPRGQLLGRRFIAALLDTVSFSLLFSLECLGMILFFAGVSLLFGESPEYFFAAVNNRFVAFVLVTCLPLFFAGRLFLQRDVGGPIRTKSLMGIMAVNHLGHPCNPEKSTLRNLPLLLFGLPVEGMVTLLRPDRRRLGDLLGGTEIIRDYVVLLRQALSREDFDCARQIASWGLRTEMSIPEAHLKTRDNVLLRFYRQIIGRQSKIIAALLDSEVIEDKQVLGKLKTMVDQQRDVFPKIHRTRFARHGLNKEHLEEFNKLQNDKLALVAALR